MVKITIRDEQDVVIEEVPGQFKACCIQPNGEILALGRDDIFHSIGTLNTEKHTIILNDGTGFYYDTLSIEVPTGKV